MFSRIIAIPLVLIFFVALYLAWEKEESFAAYMIPCVVLLAAIFAVSPQIDWWWYQRHPPKMDETFEKQLAAHFSFYKNLTTDEQKKFRDRVSLYLLANNFRAPNEEKTVPEDLKCWVAAHAVQITFAQKEYLLPKFETIILYAKNFPSPQFIKYLHASEIFEEDGALLLSAESMLRAVLQPNQQFNAVLYEYAKIFVLSYPEYKFPNIEDSEETWQALEQISGKSKDWVLQGLGLPEASIQAVSIHHFLQYKEAFEGVLPNVFEEYKQIFF